MDPGQPEVPYRFSFNDNVFMIHFTLYLIIGVALCAYVILRLKLRRTRTMLADLPSFPQLPIVGNLNRAYGDGRVWFQLLKETSEIHESVQKPFVLWLGPIPMIVTCDPDDVREIGRLVEKPFYYNFAKPWLGDGLVTASGKIWKRNIKKLAGLFTTGVVDGFQEVFNEQAEKLERNLKAEVGKPAFNVMDHLAFSTLESICQTAFGFARISESIVTAEYYRAFNNCIELMMKRGMNLLLHLDFIYQFTTGSKEFQKNVALIHEVSDTVIENRKLRKKELKENYSSTKFKPIIDILWEFGESDPLFTEKQIKWEVNTLMLGGQETVATTMFFTLIMLGRSKTVQDKLYQEVKSIFSSSKRPVQKEDLLKMPYCEAVINETLRMFPPFPGVMKYADREVELKSCKIPKGTVCCISIWGAGRSPKLWGPDAHEYNPDRWLHSELPVAAAFIPFSYGRRACIGKRYAMNIMKTILVYLVRELEFKSEGEQLELSFDLALRATAGHLIQITAREKSI